VAGERDADEQRAKQPGVYLRARAEHLTEGRGDLALDRRVQRHRHLLARRRAADQGDNGVLAAARGFGSRHECRRDALRERGQIAGHDFRGGARPRQRLDEKLLFGAKVPHDEAVRDTGPARDLPDGRARVAALGEHVARCLEDRRPRRLRVAAAPGRRAAWPAVHATKCTSGH
jgi:hypothetical protein